MTLLSLVDAVQSAVGRDIERSADVSTEQLFTQLSNERRQHIVHHLHHDIGSREIVTTRGLTEYLIQFETSEGYTSDERKRAYVALYQTHIPKLVTAGILEQVDTHEFRPGPNLAAAAEVLETAESVTGGEGE